MFETRQLGKHLHFYRLLYQNKYSFLYVLYVLNYCVVTGEAF